jgi:hypothetical protein
MDAQCRASHPAHDHSPPVVVACNDRPKSLVGLCLAARSSGEMTRVSTRFTSAPDALVARSPCAVRTRDGTVARSLVTRWRLAGGKVYLGSTSGALGWRRARRGPVGLTEDVGRR